MNTRTSSATSRNPQITSDPRQALAGGNLAWLTEHAKPGAVVFIGGAGLTDFRVRVAQSHLRNDMLPSFWSIVGIATARGLLTVPLLPSGDPSLVPSTNGIQTLRFAQFDDVEQYPNVAAVNFADRGADIVRIGERRIRRTVIDLPSLVLEWLAFVWGAGARANPLLQSRGIPGAAFVEATFGLAGIELTPGLSSSSSCPEAIWQSALWWHDYYQKTAAGTASPASASSSSPVEYERPRAVVPVGIYRCRQPAAAVAYEAPYPGRPRPRTTGRPKAAARRSTKRSTR